MPKISEQASQERRARLIEAARKVFLRRGIHVSVDEICETAGVSKGALYGYFPSKDALIQAIADTHAANFIAIEEARDAADLQRLLLIRANSLEPENCRLELEAWVYSFQSEALRERLLSNTAALRHAVEAALAALEAAGKIRLRIGAGPAAEIIATFAMGAVAKAALGDQRDSEWARSLATLLDLLAETDETVSARSSA